MHRLATRTFRVCAHVLILVLAVAVTSLLGQSAWAASVVAVATGYSAEKADTGTLQVSAVLPELRPGLRTTLDVRITNTTGTSRRILTVDAAVADASPACRADNFQVTPYARSSAAVSYDVPHGHTVVVPLPATMPNKDTNQDGCKGATFPLSLSATSSPLPG